MGLLFVYKTNITNINIVIIISFEKLHIYLSTNIHQTDMSTAELLYDAS